MATRRSFPVTAVLIVAVLASVISMLLLTTCSTASKDAKGRVYSLGERFNVGSLVYTVENVTWHQKLGEGENAHMPRAQFLLVRLTVTNSGGSTASIPQTSLELGDATRVPELASLEGVAGWLGAIRLLAPAQTISGFVAFDVKRAPAILRLADPLDPDEEGVVYVSLPIGI